MFDPDVWIMLGRGLLESLYMTLVSTAFAYLFGLPLGIAMVITDKDGIYPREKFNWILGLIINLLRSIPFLILLVMVLPITRAIVGTTIGPTQPSYISDSSRSLYSKIGGVFPEGSQ